MKQLDNKELHKLMGGGNGDLTQSTYTSVEMCVIYDPVTKTQFTKVDAPANGDDVF